jgi:hypothetical protein
MNKNNLKVLLTLLQLKQYRSIFPLGSRFLKGKDGSSQEKE